MSINQFSSPNVYLPAVNFRDLTANNLTTTQRLRVNDGTASAPSIAFSDDTNTGIYSSANDNLNVSVAGGVKLSIDSAWSNLFNYSEGEFIPTYSAGITNNQPARVLTWHRLNKDINLMLFCDITNNTGGNITNFSITNIPFSSDVAYACFIPSTNSGGAYSGIARAVISGNTLTVTIEGISNGNSGNLANLGTFTCGPTPIQFRIL